MTINDIIIYNKVIEKGLTNRTVGLILPGELSNRRHMFGIL